MYSTLSLYNLALARLGGNELATLSAPGEGSRLASLCNTLFPHVCNLAFGAHAWAFALTEETLAPVHEPNALLQGEYGLAYALPVACLRPVRLMGQGEEHRPPSFAVSGPTLYCDLAPARLQYVRRVHDTARWPAHFVEVVVWGLAAELCASYLNDPARQKLCMERAQRALQMAMATDAAGTQPKRKPFLWEEARG